MLRSSASNSAAQCGSAVLFQQPHQLSCLSAGRFALREGQVQQAFCSPARLAPDGPPGVDGRPCA